VTRKAILLGLLTIFVILMLTSMVSAYYYHQLPTRREIKKTLCNYRINGEYCYIAYLKPNTLYNKTTLKPNEGILYTEITQKIDVTFNYTFQISYINETTKPANITVEYNITQVLESSAWIKTLYKSEANRQNFQSDTFEFTITEIPSINVSQIRQNVTRINDETGTYMREYNVTVTIDIKTIATTTLGIINKNLTAKLSLSFVSSISEGDRIIPIEKINSIEDSITQSKILEYPWVTTHRNIAYLLLFISTMGTVIFAWLYKKQRKPVKPKIEYEKMIEPYEDLIIQLSVDIANREQRTVISVKSLEDLIKIADIVSKPVFHSESTPDTHNFYVIDNNIIYQYILKIKR